jgi:hypothetical protein
MSDISKAFDSIESKSSAFFRKTALNVFAHVVDLTPIEFGRAKGSWRLTYNKIDSTVEPADLGQGGYSLPTPDLPSEIDTNGTIYLTNNLKYINRLNDGHSEQQKVSGFVQRAIKTAIKETNKSV